MGSPNVPSAVVLFLADRDAPCPRCDYNLRGVQGEVCPECGQAVQLEVVRDRSVVSRWLIGLCVALMVSHVLFAAYLVVEYGSAPVMAVVPTFTVVLVFVSSGLQILMGCVGSAICVMSNRQSRALASRRLIAWTLGVVTVNEVAALLHACS